MYMSIIAGLEWRIASPSLDIPLQRSPLFVSDMGTVVLASARSLKITVYLDQFLRQGEYRYYMYCRAQRILRARDPLLPLVSSSRPPPSLYILVFNVHGSLMKFHRVMMLVAASQKTKPS